MKNNIIFLDIDGVLNGYNYLNLIGYHISSFFHLNKLYKLCTRSPFTIHKEKVKRLSKIVKATNSKIVMSSSWRFGFWNDPYDKKADDQKLLVDLFKKYNIEVIDITPSDIHSRRYVEINEWLFKHNDEVNNFVVLDDENYDLLCFVDKELVQTSSVPRGTMINGHWYENTGLKMKHVKKAIEILNK